MLIRGPGFQAQGRGFPDEDAVRLKAIWEAVGDGVSIRADANQGYTPKEAISYADWPRNMISG